MINYRSNNEVTYVSILNMQKNPAENATSTTTIVAAAQNSQTDFLFKELEVLNAKVQQSQCPQDLKDRLDQMVHRLNRMAKLGGYSSEYETVSRYVAVATSIPWGNYTKDNLSLEQAKKVLDTHHYGLDYVKERVLEYLASRKLLIERAQDMSEAARAPILCFVGLQGIGKTTIARSIAEALGRDFIRVSLGAVGSVLELRGQTKALPDAEPGQIIKSLIRTKVMNPLILLDEMDKVSGESGLRADVMAALLEILDPEQNPDFRDHYLDFPVDLSKVMFIASANTLGTMSVALLDRLEIIRMPSYTDKEKEIIAKDYLLPKVMQRVGLKQSELTFTDSLWPKFIRPLGYDSGIRSLERYLESIALKTAKMVVEGKVGKVVVDENNFKDFLPKW